MVACVQFSSAAWRISVRNRWIGCRAETRARQLVHLVSNQSLFVLPWVQVKNLASRILSRAVRSRWTGPEATGSRCSPTLVDPGRYRGSCLIGGELDRAGEHSGREREVG